MPFERLGGDFFIGNAVAFARGDLQADPPFCRELRVSVRDMAGMRENIHARLNAGAIGPFDHGFAHGLSVADDHRDTVLPAVFHQGDELSQRAMRQLDTGQDSQGKIFRPGGAEFRDRRDHRFDIAVVSVVGYRDGRIACRGIAHADFRGKQATVAQQRMCVEINHGILFTPDFKRWKISAKFSAQSPG